MQLAIKDGRVQAIDLFGFSYRRKASSPLQSVDGNRGGWWPLIQEATTGAWQKNDVQVPLDSALAYFATYACITLIARDLGKMALRLMRKDTNGIWREDTGDDSKSPHRRLLRKPNHFQNRQKFIEWWAASKKIHGNTYVLKQRDTRGIVERGYILDPYRVKPLVSESGDVFYELRTDTISRLTSREPVIVPQREIIHDVECPLFHPLVGVSPIYAAGISALHGSNIQKNSVKFFANYSQPGGVLTAPGTIADETAVRVKDAWETNFGGDNVGKVAVLGDGLTYQPMAVSAKDSELIEQLKFSAKVVCNTFHVPPYMVGIDDPPNYDNIEGLNQQYYSQCLQADIEAIENLLDAGLELPEDVGARFDIDDLIKMDSKTKMLVAKDGVGAAVMAPNEARKRFNLPPVEGGETPYLQQQNYSLAALDARDRAQPAPSDGQPPASGNEERALTRYRLKRLEASRAA